MNRALEEPVAGRRWPIWPIAGLLAAAMLGVFIFAPEEQTMGQTQRIVYIHVSVAWFGLIGYLLAAASSFMYLLRRTIAWDDWAQAAAEVGWVCASLTLATGSLWAHEAWNTWWTWDPRLTTSLILWTIYAGYFVVRSSIADRNRRARVAAVLSVVGALDVPLVVMATRWFRGMHPVSPVMEPSMRVVLLLTALAFTAFFAYLVAFRRMQLALQREVHALELESTRISPAYS
jgi:heme exporter protein C